MAAQGDPGDRTRCARKYIVIMELYGRIFKDFYVKELGEEGLLERARGIADKLNNSQKAKIAQGVNGIATWDISLFWAVHWRCRIKVDDDTTFRLESMKNLRNYGMHGNKFQMSANDEIDFFQRAEGLANYFDVKINPERKYLDQLREIQLMNLDLTREDEILKKIRAEEHVTLARQFGKIMMYVGKRFEMKKSAKREKFVLVIHEENKNHVKKIREWLKTLGRKFRKGNYEVKYEKDEEGSIIVEIVISTTTEELVADELYEIIASYIQKAYEESRIALTTPVDVVLFLNEYDDN